MRADAPAGSRSRAGASTKERSVGVSAGGVEPASGRVLKDPPVQAACFRSFSVSR
jgi:hypothetical protein